MKLIFIGLGRMGGNIVDHLLEQKIPLIVYNRSKEKVDAFVQKGAIGAYSLSDIITLNPTSADSASAVPDQNPSDSTIVVFLYVTAGEVTSAVINELTEILPPGSIIVDGGNSFFQDSQKRFQMLREKKIHFLDMGTSGGLEGARTGACLMVGGEEEIYKKVEPILAKIATQNGYGYFGPSGAGHFIKMVHNAVEYGMMGAIAEGMELVHSSWSLVDREGAPNFSKIAKVWSHGSIVSGHLMNMASQAFSKDPQLSKIEGVVPRGETEAEMEWLQTLDIPMPVIASSVKQRVETRQQPSFIGKVIAALRKEFGGHKTVEKERE